MLVQCMRQRQLLHAHVQVLPGVKVEWQKRWRAWNRNRRMRCCVVVRARRGRDARAPCTAWRHQRCVVVGACRPGWVDVSALLILTSPMRTTNRGHVGLDRTSIDSINCGNYSWNMMLLGRTHRRESGAGDGDLAQIDESNGLDLDLQPHQPQCKGHHGGAQSAHV